MRLTHQATKHLFKGLQEYWTIASVCCVGVALAFNVGYFHVLLGNIPFVVTIEDTAKSFLYVVVLWAVVQNVFFLFDDLFSSQSKWNSAILIVVGLAGIYAPPLISLYTNYFGSPTGIIYYDGWSLSVRTMTVVLLGLIWSLGEGKFDNLSVGKFITFLLILLTISYSFGAMMFYADVQKSKPITAYFENGTSVSTYLVSSRTEFYLLFSPAACTFQFIGKDKLSKLDVIARNEDVPLITRVQYCLQVT